MFCFFFQAEDGIRDYKVTGVQTCALPISLLVRLESSVVSRQSSGKKLSVYSSQLSEKDKTWPAHARLLDEIHVTGELLRSRLERKPAGSVTTAFATKA